MATPSRSGTAAARIRTRSGTLATCTTSVRNLSLYVAVQVEQRLFTVPKTTENGQTGINNCGTGSSQSSMCQTAWINDADDFCLWAPPSVGTIGDTERNEVAWCTKSGRGTRTIPNGTLKGVHFVRTPDYVQVTGVGDFTKINVPRGDAGGELDPHGPDGNGNPGSCRAALHFRISMSSRSPCSRRPRLWQHVWC
jgi:hypothetical protein